MPDESSRAPGTDELVARALALDPDDENEDTAYWALVLELQARGDRETFEAARALCLDEPDDARCLGLAILAELGFKEGRPFVEESLPLVGALCVDGESDDVLALALHAFGHLQDPRGARAVLAQRGHPDPTVRLAVAQAADGVAGEPPDPAVVEAVIELTRDDDDGVRNWATFSLALLFEVDDAAVRAALRARLDDTDAATSAEALGGLAVRADPDAADAILGRLRGPFPEQYVADVIIEAAERLGDPRFIPGLAMLREQEADPDAYERLSEAIAACSVVP